MSKAKPEMTDADFRKILEDEWQKRRPLISMGPRRIDFAIALMKLAYELGRECGWAGVAENHPGEP